MVDVVRAFLLNSPLLVQHHVEQVVLARLAGGAAA
jgi:hypothetical protein